MGSHGYLRCGGDDEFCLGTPLLRPERVMGPIHFRPPFRRGESKGARWPMVIGERWPENLPPFMAGQSPLICNISTARGL